jgi:hypothetical protein
MSESLYPLFNREELQILPLKERTSLFSVNDILPLEEKAREGSNKNLKVVAERIKKARERKTQIIFMMGAHVIRSGTSRYIIDLMQKGYITHIATNGGGLIHDFELACFGETTESVAYYIKEGQFGLWKETGILNDIVIHSYKKGLGLGEGVGRFIQEGIHPHKDISVLAAAFRLRIPATVHIGIGYDIVHEHPNCDGAAWGATSYRDFLIFAKSVQELEGGVLLCFGTQVMGPEVFLKALSMARNVAKKKGGRVVHFTSAVFDLFPICEDYRKEPKKTEYRYYFRPWKTLLVRCVADRGESFYFSTPHHLSIPTLHNMLLKNIP